MEILLKNIILYLAENHFVILPLLTVFSVVLAFLVFKQIKKGCKFYFSKRKLIEEFREKIL